MKNDIKTTIDRLRVLNENALLSERLGVPDNIVETTIQLFDNLIKRMTDRQNAIMDDGDEKRFSVDGEYKIGEFSFDNIEIQLVYQHNDEIDTIEIPRLTISNATNANKNSDRSYKMNFSIDVPEIALFVVGPRESIKLQEIKEAVLANKSEYVSRLAHELAHKYEKYSLSTNNKGASLKAYSNYNSYSEVRSGIRPIDKFIFFMYYTHKVENITRPTEIMAMLKVNKVTKDNFAQAIQQTEMYKQLVEMKNFTIKGMIDDLKNNYIEKLDALFDDENFTALSIDEKVGAVMRSIYMSLAKKSLDNLHSLLMPDFKEFIFGIDPDRQANLDSHIDYYEKNSSHYMSFFNDKQKEINKTANNMIHKISKLYDAVPDSYNDETQADSVGNLHEWMLDQERRGVEKIKYYPPGAKLNNK